LVGELTGFEERPRKREKMNKQDLAVRFRHVRSVTFISAITSVLLTIVPLSVIKVVSGASSPRPAQQTNQKRSSPAQISEGKGLFLQRCSVCHSITRREYGPMLSKDIVAEREDAVREKIKQGSTLMPGFQHGLKAAQIDAIIEYLRTVERPRTGSETQDIPD
jgi:mono/diheme cytochrome c family protein